MDKVTDFRCTTLPTDSPYVKPFRMYYTQNGVEKNWDMLKVYDSVAIIIFNKTKNTLVLVRQFRPAVYHAIISSDPDFETASPESLLAKYPVKLAITDELCAGIVDKSKPLVEIAKDEILEECGYNVPVERIELIQSYRECNKMYHLVVGSKARNNMSPCPSCQASNCPIDEEKIKASDVSN